MLDVGLGCDDDQPEGTPLAEAVNEGAVVPESLRLYAVCRSVYLDTTEALPQLDHDLPAGLVRLICHT